MYSFSENNPILPMLSLSSKETLVSDEELKNELIENMKVPNYDPEDPVKLSNVIKKILARNPFFKIDIPMWETLTHTVGMCTVFADAYREMGIEQQYSDQLCAYHHYYFGYALPQEIPFKMIASEHVITAKGYSLLAEHYNKKHKELYGYFAVGFFDDDNETFYRLLYSLDQAKEGTQFGMFYLFERGGAPYHAIAIKCEKLHGKIHLVLAETTLHEDLLDIEVALKRMPKSFLDRINLYKNNDDLQYSREPLCFALSIKYMQKMKSNDFVGSLKTRGYLTTHEMKEGIARINYQIPPEFAYLFTSPDALEKYAQENKEAKQHKFGPTESSSFEQYALKPRSGYNITSPKLIKNRNYPDKDKREFVPQNTSIFYFQEKQKAIIGELYKSKTQSELKNALDFMNPSFWHINEEGEHVPYIVTAIITALKNKKPQKVISILKKYRNLMHLPLNQQGHSLLHLAVEWSSPEVIKYLIEHKVDYHYTDKEGHTALAFGEALARKYIHRGSIILIDILTAHQKQIQQKTAYTLLIKDQVQRMKSKRKSTFFEEKSPDKKQHTTKNIVSETQVVPRV